MKKNLFIMSLCLLLMLILCSGTALAKKQSLEEKKAELHETVRTTLLDLYEKYPSSQEVVESADGYAVFVNSGLKLGLMGNSHGRGMAVNNATGDEVYMKMGEHSLGLGLGAKEYYLVFIFNSQTAWNNFVDSGWKFDGHAEAAATDGVKGDAINGALNIGHDIWVYQVTTKGLSLELSIKGTEYYRDKSFYPEIYKKK